jgi:flagellar biosynthesis protein FlhF
MRIKSYFSDSVQDALRIATQELGSDAMLLDTKDVPAQIAHRGKYEVVFGITEEQQSTDAQPASGRIAAGSAENLSVQLGELQKQVDEMRRAMAPAAKTAQLPSRQVEAIDSGSAASTSSLSLATVRRELRTDHRIGCVDGRAPVLSVIGPPGSGKTTTAAKLAVQEGTARGRRVRFASAGVGRVGHSDHLRAYARIFGAEFTTLNCKDDLILLLSARRSDELLVIDTPGLSPGDAEERQNMQALFAGQSGIDTHLVLPAGMRTADLPRMLDLFEPLSPSKLLFTRLDETTSFATVALAAVMSGLPLSYFGTGQQIPEDIMPVCRDEVLEKIEGGEADRLLSAA